MKAVSLARVSTREQEETGHSLPAQIESLRKYAEKKSFNIEKEFRFSESAGPKIRKKFEEVLAYIRKHHVKVLLCENVDRATRNFKDAVDLDEMRKNEGLEIHFVKDGFFINKDATGNQMFMWEAKVFLAKQYLNRLSDDVKRSIWQKFENHEWPSKAPIGYKNITGLNDKKEIIPDEDNRHLIVKMFEEYATGNSSHHMLRLKMFELGLKSQNGSPLSVSMIAHILQNPFYYGLMRLEDKENTHHHGALISKELFDKCEAVREGWHKKPFKFAAKDFIFKGLIRCENCGCSISAEEKRKKSGWKRNYYSCNNYRKKCKRLYIPEPELLKPIYKALKGLKMPQKRIDEITEGLRKLGQSEGVFHKQNMATLKREYDILEGRISKMYDDRLDGRITEEMYDKKLKEFKERQANILSQMQIHSSADAEFYITANMVLSLAQRALEIFESSEVDEKRQFLNFLLQNCQLQGKKLLFELKSPFDTLISCANEPIRLGR